MAIKGLLLFVVATTTAAFAASQYYDEKFDKININDVVNNNKLLNFYSNCFLEKGPCSALSKELRELIKDAMKTNCNRCSPKQKVLIRTLWKAVNEKNPKVFHEVLDKFDPTSELRGEFKIVINYDSVE